MSGDPVHARFLRSRPPRSGLRALVEHLEPGAMVAKVRRLKGGVEASTHRIDLVTRTGTRRALVLRRFSDSSPWFDVARLSREAATLASLGGTAVPAPEVVLLDEHGEWMGTPTMVLTCLAGRPAPPDRWVASAPRLVEALAAIHDLAPVVEAEPWLTAWRHDEEPPELAGDPRLASVWPHIVASRAALAGSAGDALVHHDFHPGNTLWSRGRVTGVVDWPLAGRGYPAHDRAYLRLDVSICLGLEAGDAVAAASAAAGIERDHAAWDLVAGLHALPDPAPWVAVYNEIGVPVTLAEGRARLVAWFDRAIAELR